MKKSIMTDVAINPNNIIKVDGQDFIGTQISLVQFAILAIFYQYGDDGIVDGELLAVTKDLYQRYPIHGLTFDEDNILPICSQLIIKDLLARGKNGFVITNKGKNYFNSFLDIGSFITKRIPQQKIIDVQSEYNLPKKI